MEEHDGESASLRGNRPFQAIMGAYTLTSVFYAAVGFAVPVVYLKLHGSLAQTALIATVDALASALVLLLAGPVSDRFPRVQIMRLGQLADLVASFVLFLVVRSNLTTLWVWLLIAGITSCVGAFDSNAESASVKSIVADTQMFRAMNLRQGRSFVATLLGPTIAGALIQFSDKALVFLLAAAASLLSLLLLTAFLRVSDVPVPERVESGSKLAFALSGFKRTVTDPLTRGVSLAMLAVGFAGGMLLPGLVYGFTRQGVAPTVISLVTILGGLGGLAGLLVLSPLVDQRQWKIGRTAALALVVEAAASGIAALVDVWPAYIVAVAVMCAMVPLVSNGVMGFLATYTPNELQGRVFASQSLISSVVAAIVPNVVALLLSIGNLSVTMLGVSGIYLLAALAVLLNRILREIPGSKAWDLYMEELQQAA